MKAAVRTIFVLSVLACSQGMAETPGVVASATVQNAAPPAVKVDPTGVKKDTVVEIAEEARRLHTERIRKMQEAQDTLNMAIADSLREQAKRFYRERESRKTGGAQAYPQEPSAGSTSKK